MPLIIVIIPRVGTNYCKNLNLLDMMKLQQKLYYPHIFDPEFLHGNNLYQILHLEI